MTFGNTLECSKSADKLVPKSWVMNISVSSSLLIHTISSSSKHNPIV